MDPETRQKKLELCSKLEERDALLKLEANLRKQLELINQSKAQQQQQQQVNVQQNRLQSSGGARSVFSTSGGTLTNQRGMGGGNADTSPVGDLPESWVFLDASKE